MKRILIGSILAAVAFGALATVPSTDSRQDFTGDSSTTIFTFTVQAAQASWIEVLLNGTTQTSGYTVTLNGSQSSSPGGTVTFDSAPGSGAVVRVQRTVPLTQDSVWAPYSAFKAKTLEGQLDKLVMQDQQLARDTADLDGRVTTLESTVAGLGGGSSPTSLADTGHGNFTAKLYAAWSPGGDVSYSTTETAIGGLSWSTSGWQQGHTAQCLLMASGGATWAPRFCVKGYDTHGVIEQYSGSAWSYTTINNATLTAETCTSLSSMTSSESFPVRISLSNSSSVVTTVAVYMKSSLDGGGAGVSGGAYCLVTSSP